MARPLRIQYPDAWYHVMNRGRRGEPVFMGPDDYAAFLDILREARELWNFRIAAYCLMSNHYHLLVQTPDANLSRCMRHINGVYTQRFNRLHAGDGPLFRGRYKAILVDADAYLLELVRYIHRNPVRAGLVTSPDRYPWSSHSGYMSEAQRWGWLYKEFVLSLFAKDLRESRREYERFVAHDDHEDLMWQLTGEKVPVVIGKESFVVGLQNRFSGSGKNDENPESRMFLPATATIKRYICEVYGVTEHSLLKSTRGVTNEPRNVAIYLTRYLRGDRLEDIGQAYGIEKYSSVSSTIERMKKQIARDTSLSRRIDQIKRDITDITKSQEQT